MRQEHCNIIVKHMKKSSVKKYRIVSKNANSTVMSKVKIRINLDKIKNKTITPIRTLMKNYKYIIMPNDFNKAIKKNTFSKGTVMIIFGEKFNKNLKHIPKSIKYLELGKNYSLNVKNLPRSIVKFTMHNDSKAKYDVPCCIFFRVSWTEKSFSYIFG